jgi:hypothetical protein
MVQCAKCGIELSSKEESKTWNHQLKRGYLMAPILVYTIYSFSGNESEFPEYKGKKLCEDCAMSLFGHKKISANDAPLLQCKDASLTNKDFHHQKESLLISDMIMALVENNGSLSIIFKDGNKREFRLGLSTGTVASAAGLVLFGGIGSLIAGNMALSNQIKATSQQWASAINCLISKNNLPEWIYCKYCGSKNKSVELRCLHCGAAL